jgi:hypothetical protein
MLKNLNGTLNHTPPKDPKKGMPYAEYFKVFGRHITG